MLKPSFLKTLLGAATILSSSGVSAALFDFNTTNFGLGGTSTVDSASMTVDGITVDLTAFTIANNGSGAISGMTQLGGGTGVYVSGSSNNVGVRSNLSGDGTNMDGGSASSTTDLDEGILFTFDQVVRLTFVNFDSFNTSASNSDDFNLTVDGVSLLIDHDQDSSDVAGIVTNTADADHFNFSVTGTEFLIWADSDSDSFRIDSLRVSAVPVPAAFWLFGSGLIGLIGVARRKKA